MVILSLPSMSNSFLGHPEKSEFSAATGQAALIQIKHVRYRTDCRSDRSLCRQFFIPSSNRRTADRRTYRLRRISRLPTQILLSRPNLPPPDISGVTEIYSRLKEQASQQSQWSRRECFLFRSVLYFCARPIINLRFFP